MKRNMCGKAWMNRYAANFLKITVVLGLLIVCLRRGDARLPSSGKSGAAIGYGTNCEPRTKIGFLKVHKCASSTVQNLFMRYAYKHSLNVAVPSQVNENYLGNPEHFKADILKNSPGYTLGYDMFLLHTRWSQTEVEKILGNDATYVTILRHPVDLFESLFSYGEMDQMYNATMSEFIQDIKEGRITLKHRRRLNGRYGWNQIAWDFGLSPYKFNRAEEVTKLIELIDRKFSLVMISEKMDESLILLHDLLCWTLDDVVSLKLNARRDETRTILTPEQREVLEKWLSADMMIYDHFKRKFERLVEKHKHTVLRKLDTIKRKNDQLEQRCFISKLTNDQIKDKSEKQFSDKAFSFLLRDTSECRLYGLKENEFINELRTIQRQREYLEHNGTQ